MSTFQGLESLDHCKARTGSIVHMHLSELPGGFPAQSAQGKNIVGFVSCYNAPVYLGLG